MRGTVLFWRQKDDKPDGVGFGFIAPDGATHREEHCWFGPKALRPLKGRLPRCGDIVEYELGDYKQGKGPQAGHIFAILDDEREITTLEGIDDVA